MDQVTLKAAARDTKSTAKQLRRAGDVPCVVYGNTENTQLQCPEKTLKQAYMKAGESTLVNLDVEGKSIPVLFHSIDFDPVTSQFAHVDFYAVNMNKEVEASVALHFEGESPAVKGQGGILVTPLTHVTVRCLPKNLPHNLTVKIDGLTEFHMSMYVKDIALPSGVEIVEDAETVIVTVQEPRKEEEVVVAAPTETAATAGTPGPIPGATEGAAAPAAEKKDDKKK